MSTIVIATVEPRYVTAGETALWQRDLPDYPASTWSLNYYLRGANGSPAVNIAASANGSVHEVNVNVATTSNWTAGNYAVYARVSDGTLVFPVAPQFPWIEVKANPTSANIPNISDVRPWQYQALEDVEAALLALSSKTVTQASVNGTFYGLVDIDKLYGLRTKLKNEIAAIETPAGRLVYTRFTNPL